MSNRALYYIVSDEPIAYVNGEPYTGVCFYATCYETATYYEWLVRKCFVLRNKDKNKVNITGIAGIAHKSEEFYEFTTT